MMKKASSHSPTAKEELSNTHNLQGVWSFSPPWGWNQSAGGASQSLQWNARPLHRFNLHKRNKSSFLSSNTFPPLLSAELVSEAKGENIAPTMLIGAWNRMLLALLIPLMHLSTSITYSILQTSNTSVLTISECRILAVNSEDELSLSERSWGKNKFWKVSYILVNLTTSEPLQLTNT